MTTTLLLLYKQGHGCIQYPITVARSYIIALYIMVSNCQLPPSGGSKLDLGKRASPETYERQRPFRTYCHKALNGCGVCQVCLWCLIPADAETHIQHQASCVAMERLLINNPQAQTEASLLISEKGAHQLVIQTH